MQLAPHLHYQPVLKRTFAASPLNAVANHPEVRPHIGGEGELDLSAMIANPANFALETNGGGFVMQALESGIYEVHSLFLPEARWQTLQAMRDGMRYMFCRTDCFRLVTQVPAGNEAAAALARKGGFVPWFKRGGDSYLSLDLDSWIANADWADEIGHDFHEVVGEAVNHGDDETHDRFVGVAIDMANHGNVGKGIGAYNRWARFAGYVPASIISVTPLVVDIGNALVTLESSRPEVLPCQ